MLDGPLHGIRHRRGLPVIGYVKTHHRRMLAGEHWVRVPELTAGKRVGPLPEMEDPSMAATCVWATSGRGQVPGRASPALEMPSGIGRAAARSRRPTGTRAGCRASRRRCTGTRGPPVNPTPIAGLERASAPAAGGTHAFALRAVREAVLGRNREGRTP